MTHAETEGEEAHRAAAADWIGRLGADDLTEHDLRAFDAWLSAHAAHARAYDAVLAIAHEFEAASSAVVEGLREATIGGG